MKIMIIALLLVPTFSLAAEVYMPQVPKKAAPYIPGPKEGVSIADPQEEEDLKGSLKYPLPVTDERVDSRLKQLKKVTYKGMCDTFSSEFARYMSEDAEKTRDYDFEGQVVRIERFKKESLIICGKIPR